MNSLFGAGLLGLRSLATGIPAAMLANPRAALARGRTRRSRAVEPSPQFIILATSGDGDPLNANCPGSYTSPMVGHPSAPSMAPTALQLVDGNWVAALPWSQLPQDLLNRSCFFHHATNTVVHPDEGAVLALNGSVADHEMLISLLASQLGPALGTIQSEPVVLGPRQASEALRYAGHPEPILSPSALASLLAPPTGPLGRLTAMRDADLDRLNALVRSEGNPGKNSFLDDYALSQRQARELSDQLLSALALIRDDGPMAQITAAVTLIRMKVAPVISVHIPFGGDNHFDNNLATEVQQTIEGLGTIQELWRQLVAAGLQDQVSFLSFNVFGRTLRADRTQDGRDHNGDHHVSLMFGAPFRGCVIGGVEPVGDDMGAMSIVSSTGSGIGNNEGDISRADTLQSMARTFGQGVGVSSDVLARNITGGKVVPAAFST